MLTKGQPGIHPVLSMIMTEENVFPKGGTLGLKVIRKVRARVNALNDF